MMPVTPNWPDLLLPVRWNIVPFAETIAPTSLLADSFTEPQPNPDTATFAGLGLPQTLLDAVNALGFTTPTPIQAAVIPALLAGEDIVGVARTGTGKTAAFGLPLLARVDPTLCRTQALVLTPTRELALQVADALTGLARGRHAPRVAAIYGGASLWQQKQALDAGAHVIVATPGRLIDHLERGTADLGGVTFAVLDEGDEMMRLGFADEVEAILGAVPSERQTALFSATMPPAIRHTVEAHLRHPRTIAVTSQGSTGDTIEQRFAVVPSQHKAIALARILAITDAEAALVFVNTKASAESVGAALVARGVAASVISGDVPQAERERIVERLRSGQLDVLVATDVAARGLDVDRIGLVINLEIPREADSYVHRIGRTGRAGRSGVAFSLVTAAERQRLRRIERAIHVEMTPTPVPTRSDVVTHRVSALLARVPQRAAAGDLAPIRQAVEAYLGQQMADATLGAPDMACADGGVWHPGAVELATALAALAVDDRSSASDDDLDDDLARLAHGDHPGRTGDRPNCGVGRTKGARQSFDEARSARQPRHGASRPATDVDRYWVGVGRRHGAAPAGIVGAITSEGSLRGCDLGRIDVFGDFSIVEIIPTLSRGTLERLSRVRTAGRTLRIRPDAGHAPHRER